MKPRGPFTVPSGDSYEATLVRKLTPAADKIRDLRTRLGGSPYRVSLVVTEWSGGVRNRGIETVVSVIPIVPLPKVSPMSAMDRTLQNVGIDEVGAVTVSDISAAYTEDQLVGVGPQGEAIPQNQNFYWEIIYPRPAPQAAVKRRYTVAGSPSYNPTRFGWQVTLVKAGEERDRVDGTPQGD